MFIILFHVTTAVERVAKQPWSGEAVRLRVAHVGIVPPPQHPNPCQMLGGIRHHIKQEPQAGPFHRILRYFGTFVVLSFKYVCFLLPNLVCYFFYLPCNL